jgi:hypothetical protein
VLNELAACRVDLTTLPIGPPEPIMFPYVNVEVDGMKVPFFEPEECESMDGWVWIEEGSELIFCGSYCDALRIGDSQFEVVYGCPSPD